MDVKAQFEVAMQQHDADTVEDLVMQAELTPELIPTLIEVMRAPWHFQHENLALIF